MWRSGGTSGRKEVNDLVIAGREFRSRLFMGTGKFSSPEVMVSALEASGCEMVTVAVRRVDLLNPQDPLMEAVDWKRFFLLPNTSGARTASEAVRVAQLARAATGTHWIKLEVTPDPRSLLPDPVDTLLAAEILVKEGFIVLPYMPADVILARRLEEVGCSAVMPLGSPIGTKKGLRTRDALEVIIAHAGVPVVVDAGLGAPSHCAEAMELGADACLVNTAVAAARDPAAMARAMAAGVAAGRDAWLAGMAGESGPEASSPLTGIL